MVVNKDDVTVTINGRDKTFSKVELSPDGELSYEQVVSAAFPTPPAERDIVYTVTYSNGAGRPPKGILHANGKVKVQDGTTFEVQYTSGA